MSIGLGPKISNDGLIFAMDAGNIRSFRGEPTTNVVNNPLPSTEWGLANANGSAGLLTMVTEDGSTFMRLYDVTSVSGYPRYTGPVLSSTITGAFSTSFEAKGTPGAVLYLRIYENGSTKITNVATLTDEWKRFTFENQTTGFNLNQPYFHPFTSDAIYDIRNIQIEAKSYATSFVDGTRGSTVATGGGWKDLSGNNNDLDLSDSPSEVIDTVRCLDFNGSSNYLLNVHNGNIDFNNLDFTKSAWVKVEGGSGTYRSIFANSVGTSTTRQSNLVCGTDNRWQIWLTLNDVWGQRLVSNQSIVLNKWTNITVVYRNLNSVSLYIDGVLDKTATLTGSLSYNPTHLLIGKRYGDTEYFNGKIASLKIYNDQLSEQEIQQNFNATRGRFGI